MNDNPWTRVPEVQDFVLEEDRISVKSFNDKIKNDSFRLQVDKMLPEPFIGDVTASVVLLSNNPGIGKWADLRKTVSFMTRIRNNLSQARSDYPFFYLDPVLAEAGSGWWDHKLKALLKLFDRKALAQSIVNIPYHGYPSQRYRHPWELFPSQEFGFRLVQQAIDAGRTIVLMRTCNNWLESVPKLANHPRCYRVKNHQIATISPGNCEEFDKVVAALDAAGCKRL